MNKPLTGEEILDQDQSEVCDTIDLDQESDFIENIDISKDNQIDIDLLGKEFEERFIATGHGSGLYKRMNKPFDINIPIKNQIPRPEKGTGVIYLLFARPSKKKKKYIGQTGSYTEGNSPYGSKGRWGSHISEATAGSNDHSICLNNAIRCHKPENFLVATMLVTKSSELDKWERFFIKIFDTRAPNGYNIHPGGKKGKGVSESTSKKMSENLKKRVITDEYRKKISQSQVGNRRETKERRNPDDAHLPKHISGLRDKGKLYGYSLSYPIGLLEKEYVNKTFSNARDPTKALELTKKYLAQLEIKYKDLPQQRDAIRKKQMEESIQLKMMKKHKKKLPPYIEPIMVEGKPDGYLVKGYLDWNGDPYPEKEFSQLSGNRRNLAAANRYVNQLDIKNKDALFKETIPDELVDYEEDQHRWEKFNHLPHRIIYTVVDGKIIGYQLNGFKTASGTIIAQKFCGTKLSMEDKYKLVTDFLIKLVRERNAAMLVNDEKNDDDDDDDNDNNNCDLDQVV